VQVVVVKARYDYRRRGLEHLLVGQGLECRLDRGDPTPDDSEIHLAARPDSTATVRQDHRRTRQAGSTDKEVHFPREGDRERIVTQSQASSLIGGWIKCTELFAQLAGSR
jgi:hypothetical protein